MRHTSVQSANRMTSSYYYFMKVRYAGRIQRSLCR